MTVTNLALSRRPPKPTLGGWADPVEFEEAQAAAIDALADTLIPEEGGFPAPSSVNVLGFFRRYVTPKGQPAVWYPFLSAEDIAGICGWLGDGFAAADEDSRVAAVGVVERDHAEMFNRVRDLVYQAYYSRPEVIAAINAQLPAGKDYRITPQPFGYADVIEDWDEDLLGRVQGSYIRTEDVTRVPLPDTLAGPNEVVVGSWMSDAAATSLPERAPAESAAVVGHARADVAPSDTQDTQLGDFHGCIH